MAVPRLWIPVQCHVGDGSVVLNLELQPRSKVFKVTHHCVGVGEEVAGIVSEEQAAVVAEQRVPVMAEVELAVGFACVPFVDADELAMAGVEGKEAARCVAAFEHHIISARLLEEIGHLQARGAGSYDAVVMMHKGRGTAGAGQAHAQDKGQEQTPCALGQRDSHGGAVRPALFKTKPRHKVLVGPRAAAASALCSSAGVQVLVRAPRSKPCRSCDGHAQPPPPHSWGSLPWTWPAPTSEGHMADP